MHVNIESITKDGAEPFLSFNTTKAGVAMTMEHAMRKDLNDVRITIMANDDPSCDKPHDGAALQDILDDVW